MTLLIVVAMVTMILIAMIALMDVDIMIGNENAGKNVKEYMNNNEELLANKIEIVMNGIKDAMTRIKNTVMTIKNATTPSSRGNALTHGRLTESFVTH